MSIVLAGNESASYTPPELFAGEADIVTNAYTLAASQTLAQYTVVAMLTANNQVVAWDPSGADGSEIAIGVLCFAATTGVGETPVVPVYVGGYFNTDSLVWDGAATDAEKEVAFINTNITHRALSGA